MFLNDLNSAKHNVQKLNKVLADSFNHEVDLSSMNMDSLNRMLNTTEAKMMAIKESDLKYWENPQYNKLGLIQHQLKTYINEVAPTRTDGKKMKAKTESVVMEDELEQAEVLLAAQELVDELQGMVEDVAEMQVQKLMPIVDAMKEQVGFEQAEAYNAAADAALGALLDQMKLAKESVENATLAARGQAPATPAPTDMAADPEAPSDMDMDVDIPSDDFDGDNAASGEDNAIGRELKGESAIGNMEGRALAEKKFLESKDRLFKMVESGQMSHTDFINVINELDASTQARLDQLKQANPGRSDASLLALMDIMSRGGYDSRDNKRGFTPGQQVDPTALQNRRGFTPGQQVPPASRGVMGQLRPATGPDEIDYERELSSNFTGRKEPMDGGIAMGTTRGGPSLLRQRQMAKTRLGNTGPQ